MLVFEDLRDDQFKAINSMTGLDTDQLKLTLLTLAKWHAGTATLLLTVSSLEIFQALFNYIFNLIYKMLPFRMLNSSIGLKNASIIEIRRR